MMEDKSDIIRLVCEDLIRGDEPSAKNQLKKLELKPKPDKQKRENKGKTKRGTISKSKQIKVFKENNFICQYCGKRTVFIGTLRAIYLLLGDDFPYQIHWKWDSTHPVIWELTASCDHRIPVARGGSDELDNLTTACYLCNSLKTQWTIEELKKSGWIQQNKPVEDNDWDGLTGLFLDIMKKKETEIKIEIGKEIEIEKKKDKDTIFKSLKNLEKELKKYK